MVSGAGGAGRAVGQAAEAGLLNPALIPLAPAFEGVAYYQDGYWAREEHQNLKGVTLLDNHEGVIVPGSLSYLQSRRTFVEPTTQASSSVEEELWQGSIGKFYNRHWSLGLSALRLSSKFEGREHVQWNGVAGVYVVPHPLWSLGFVYYNPFHPSSEVSESIRLVPQVSLGAALVFPHVARLSFDLSRWEKMNPDKKWIYQLGLETFVAEFLSLRFGGDWDDNNKRTLATAGLSFNGPRLRLDYAVQKQVRNDRGAVHNLALRLSF